MDEIKRGTVEIRYIGADYYSVTVFVGEIQITKPTPPILRKILNPCIGRFSGRAYTFPVEAASDRNLLIQPLGDVDGFIQALGLECLKWPC